MLQHIEMVVFGHNILGIGNDGTIDKFIVIGISFYQSKSISRREPTNIITLGYSIQDIGCQSGTEIAGDDLFVLFEYLC